MNIDGNTRIIDLTLNEFQAWCIGNGFMPRQEVQPTRRWVYGIQGIADLFGVSPSTASRLKKSIIKNAVSQWGRNIITDAELALQLFKEHSETQKQ